MVCRPAPQTTNPDTCAQVVSQAPAAGRVAVVQSLADIQGQVFQAQTVVVAGSVGGMEDIPVRPPFTEP